METTRSGACAMAAQPPGPRRGMPEAERRDYLLAVAHDVFVEGGYAAANMDEVARAAGMSKKTLYQLFASKAALFEAVVTHHLAKLRAEVDDTGLSLEEALVRRLLAPAMLLLSTPQIGLFRLVSAEGGRYPEVAEAFHRAGPGNCESGLERWISEQVAAGRLRLDNAKDATDMLFGMAIGVTHIKLLLRLRETPPAEQIQAQIRRAVAIFLNGCATGA